MTTPKPEQPTFNKGDRAAVVGGKSGIGVRGEVFWIGENKYGPGWRYGLRGDDGNTYWVDQNDIGREEGAPPPPPPPPEVPQGEGFDKGARVTIIDAPNGQGISGNVFWVGESRYSKAPRYGIKGDDGETYWVDHHQVEAAAGAADGSDRAAQPRQQRAPRQAPSAPPVEAPPLPLSDDDLPPEAFMDEQPLDDFSGLPPDDDIPF